MVISEQVVSMTNPPRWIGLSTRRVEQTSSRGTGRSSRRA
jgi:hypothetical protein